MLNNNGPRYKRSGLERTTNFDILWCVLILAVMCTTGAVFSMIWLNDFLEQDSAFHQIPFLTYVNLKDVSSQVEALENFGSFIISLQVLFVECLHRLVLLIVLSVMFHSTPFPSPPQPQSILIGYSAKNHFNSTINILN